MFSGLFQPMHILLILIVVLLIWGPSKIANLGHDLGKGIKDFKKALNEPQEIDVTPGAKEKAPSRQA